MLCRMEDGCAHPGEQANKNEESSILSCSGYDGSGDIDDQTSEAQCPSEAVTVPVSEGLESHAARPDDSSVAAQAEMASTSEQECVHSTEGKNTACERERETAERTQRHGSSERCSTG